jgi:hypothetical protein
MDPRQHFRTIWIGSIWIESGRLFSEFNSATRNSSIQLGNYEDIASFPVCAVPFQAEYVSFGRSFCTDAKRRSCADIDAEITKKSGPFSNSVVKIKKWLFLESSE